MSITAAKLQTEIDASTTGFDRGMAHADQAIAKAPSKWGNALKIGGSVALGIGAGLVVKGVVGAISAGITSLKQQGVVVAQTNAVLKSTGAAAHVTAQDIRDLSNATEDKTAIDDKAVQAGANMLLTFTNIRNEVGAGNDIFNQSVSILADMSTAMGTDMKSGAIQLGKALNDPLKGITALTRVGVTFDDQQKKRIEKYVKEGKVAEAQKVILAELNKEFGGSGAAFAATDAGQAARFQDAIEGVQQALATGLLPAVTNIRSALDSFLRDPATLNQMTALGDSIASIFSEGNIKTAASVMTTAAQAIGTAISLFSQLPPQVQALAVGAVALNKITGISPLDIVKTAVGAFKGVLGVQAAVVNVTGGVVNGVGPGLVPTATGAAGALASVGGVAGLTAIMAVAAPLAVVAVVAGLSGPQSKFNDQGVQTEGMAMRPGGVLGIDPTKLGPKGGGGTTNPVDRTIRRLIGDFGMPHPGSLNAGVTALPVAATALASTATTLTAIQIGLREDFRAAIEALRKAATPAAIVAAVNALTKDVRGGVGNAAQTKALVDDLTTRRNAALKAGDKTTAAALDAAIKSIAGLVPGRAHQAAVLAKADKIVNSNESTKMKIEDLKGLQREMTSVGRTTAANIIQSKIDIVAAVDRTTAAISNIRAAQIATGHGPTETDQGPSGANVPFVPSKPAAPPPHAPGRGPTIGDALTIVFKTPGIGMYEQTSKQSHRFGRAVPT